MSKTKEEVPKKMALKKKKRKKWKPPKGVRVPDVRKGINTGVWTPEEHLLFLYGIKKFGNKGQGWCKKVQLFVPTRSLHQLATHNQKMVRKDRDVFKPLRENRELAHYLFTQLLSLAHDILRRGDKQQKGT